MTFSLEELNARVLARASADPAESYTATLLGKGVAKCAQKVGEEAVELAIAAVSADKAATVSEAGDVIYHLLVLLKSADVTLDQVMERLEARTAQSGHAEKSGRGKP